MRNLLLATFLLLGLSASAQFLTPYAYSALCPDLIYIEVGGSGRYYALNYEQLLGAGDHVAGTARVGFSVFPEGDQVLAFHLPLTASLLLGAEQFWGEIGGGATIAFDNRVLETGARVLPAGLAGVRYHPTRHGRVFLRLAYTPLWESGRLRHGAGFAVGLGLERR